MEKNVPEEVRMEKNIPLQEEVILMGMNDSNTTTDVRFPIRGIMDYKSLNTIFGHFSICDIQSYRECLGYFGPEDQTQELSGEQKMLLQMENTSLDSLFDEELFL